MPFIDVKTNIKIENKEVLKGELGRLISLIPGKSESWLMVDIEDNQNMYFKGSDAPLMMVEVKIYGSASESALNNFTLSVTNSLSLVYNVPKNRIYVSYFMTPFWGYDGENF